MGQRELIKVLHVRNACHLEHERDSEVRTTRLATVCLDMSLQKFMPIVEFRSVSTYRGIRCALLPASWQHAASISGDLQQQRTTPACRHSPLSRRHFWAQMWPVASVIAECLKCRCNLSTYQQLVHSDLRGMQCDSMPQQPLIILQQCRAWHAGDGTQHVTACCIPSLG